MAHLFKFSFGLFFGLSVFQPSIVYGLTVQRISASDIRRVGELQGVSKHQSVELGPDPSTKPNYDKIHGPLGQAADDLFMKYFRSKLAKNAGVDSSLPQGDYQGLMELTAALNARYQDRRQVQKVAQQTLRDLFPSWLPKQFAVLFAKPFPEFSARMNAWATKLGGTWLMGECEITDVEVEGKVHKDQGLLVKRCRFLEESGCASICVNACKIPTQDFFAQDMGLALTMTPDYETHECQFSFGVLPDAESERQAMNTPCLSRCPTNGNLRAWHYDRDSLSSPRTSNDAVSTCQHMETEQVVGET